MLENIKGRVTPTIAAAGIAGILVVGSGGAVAAGSMYGGWDIKKESISANKLTDAARAKLKGADGAQGPAGPMGLIGPVGPIGATGPAGADGAVGATGAKGAPGAPGATGATGATGETGPTGATGETGLRGDKGDRGEPGVQGPKGDTGDQGIAGPKGDTGIQGIQGIQGETGPVGPPGPGADQFGTDLGVVKAGDSGEECTTGSLTLTAGNVGNGIPAHGQLLNINNNTVLFALLGTEFGGDGINTFAVPDLRDAAPDGTTYMICDNGWFPAPR